MKKFLAIIVTISFVLCLTACNKDGISSDVTSNISGDVSQTTSTESQIGNSTETSVPAETSKPTEPSKPTETSKPTDSSEPTHTHVYSTATCTEPAKCSCGKIRGGALGHSWKKATCTTPKTCSRCGTTSGKALGHDFPATGGSINCARCGELDSSLNTPPFNIEDWLDDVVNERVYINKTTDVYVYSGADEKVVGTLSEGEIVTRTRRGRIIGGPDQIDYNGQRAYVDSDCLSVAEVYGFFAGNTYLVEIDEEQSVTLTYLGKDNWEDSYGQSWESNVDKDGLLSWKCWGIFS